MFREAQSDRTFHERLYEAESRDEFRRFLFAQYEATVRAEGQAKADERLFVWIMTHAFTLTAVNAVSADEGIHFYVERLRLERSGVHTRGRWQKRQGSSGFVWLPPTGRPADSPRTFQRTSIPTRSLRSPVQMGS